MDLFSTKIAYAASSSLNNFVGKVDVLIINPLIKFLFALAVVYFLYGVFQFFLNPESEEVKTTAKSHMLWGVIGITIMLGVWTILGIVINTFDIKGINPEQGTVNLDY
jgi:succinate dehydrogenase/fumarate reductase cytochrome b subunit